MSVLKKRKKKRDDRDKTSNFIMHLHLSHLGKMLNNLNTFDLNFCASIINE